MIVVFDLDGTLIDSTERHCLLMESLLRENRIELPQSFCKDFLHCKAEGYSGKYYLEYRLGLNDIITNKIINKWTDNIEKDRWLLRDRLYDDALEICESVFRRGNIIYYLSSRQNKAGVINEIKRLKLDSYSVKNIIINPRGKVKKEDILIDIKKTQSDCLMVGDTEVDYQAAMIAKTHYFILNRGFRNKNYWDKKGVKSFESLCALISQI